MAIIAANASFIYFSKKWFRMSDLQLPDKVTAEDGSIKQRYVAFCDVLGFSDAVKKDFISASKVYLDFINHVRLMEPIGTAEVTVYSDSIIVSSDELEPVLSKVQLLWWSALTNNWLIRGGVSYGRVWQHQTDKDLFVVSEPLVKAAQFEKSVRVPAVLIDPAIEIPPELWMARFANGPLSTPILHFNGMNIVNPFNNFWYQSAYHRVEQMIEDYPQHSDKYYWFLALAGYVGSSSSPLVPMDVLTSFKDQGIIKFLPSEFDEESPED